MRARVYVTILMASVLVSPHLTLATTVYFNDFQGSIGTEWSHRTPDVTPSGRRFLGQFGNDTVTLTLQNLPAHTQVTLSFDLFIINSWDGNGHPDPWGIIWGPDIWGVALHNGPTLLRTTFDNHYMDYYYPFNQQSYPGQYPGGGYDAQTGAAAANTLGYLFENSVAMNAVYALRLPLTHSASTLLLDFSGSGLEGLWNESWGLDNVKVEINGDAPVPPAGRTAYDPFPADEARNVTSRVLQWKAGHTAVYHDVYFSHTANLHSRTLMGRYTTTEYIIPSALVPGATCYWRVDEVEADGKTTYQGDTWSFTVADKKALVVSASGAGSVLTPGEGEFQVDAGTVLPLDAVPADPNLEFKRWSGTAVEQDKVQDPGAAQTTILVDGNYTLEAEFGERADGPVLGFSLGELQAYEPNEFNYRVGTNNTSQATFVERVTGDPPDPTGMVRMHTIQGQPARAKCRFGKCYTQRVLVQFQYIFESANASQIVVYLSDVNEPLEPGDPLRAEHYIEIGRVPAPPGGRPGSFNSKRFGTFEQWAWVEGLDFSRGTWVELELVAPGKGTAAMSAQGAIHLASNGADASASFDGASVQVQCSGYCMDLNRSMSVTSEDILLVLASYGSTAALDKGAADSRYCLDGAFSDDGYVDSFDVSSWDWALEDTLRVDCGSLCRWHMPLSGGSSVATSATTVSARPSAGGLQSAAVGSWPAALLILGKPQWTMRPSNALAYNFYLFDSSPAYKADYVTAGLPTSCNIRLVRGRAGQVYLVNSEQGVLQLSDSSATQVIAPGKVTYASDPRHRCPATIYVGIQGQHSTSFGRPIFDVAFDSQGYAYVVPVVVQANGYEPYEVAAKLKLDSAKGPSSWQVVQLYDDDPPPDTDNQERNYLREIEIDDAGNVYLLNAHRRNESDLLWMYNDNAIRLQRWELAVPGRAVHIPDPLGLTVPADGATMYLASGQLNRQDPNSTVIYGLLTESPDAFVVRQITVKGMALVSSMTEDPMTGALWVLGFHTAKVPPRPGMKEQFAHTPRLAKIPLGATVVQATDITGSNYCDLALPTSIVSTWGAR